ncbi:lytic transglycosylase domain-containing protein [Asticcacaulis machinosus]|uniref:Lytic transglycosylase domain-containing protein n=1 Tax=Asticcacaulis machinosus TaxID=2984211 RepID=A0ABT5HHN1_9CAUL|nr:lytic transglycosylase domain-containing protein [Asticcacaulis machinosus]MDC7675518.1 lytic transglycosylase domain-containing protein [Asticcacaulis machinosus]
MPRPCYLLSLIMAINGLEAPPATAQTYAAEIHAAAQRFGVHRAWIEAVIRIESDGRPDARSAKGAVGLMQLMPETFAEIRHRYRLPNDIAEPRTNILAGTAYLRELFDLYGVPGAFAAYNAGPHRYDQYLLGVRHLPPETRLYVDQIASLTGISNTRLKADPDQNISDNWSRSSLFPTPEPEPKPHSQRQRTVKAADDSETEAPEDPVPLPSPDRAGLFPPTSIVNGSHHP